MNISDKIKLTNKFIAVVRAGYDSSVCSKDINLNCPNCQIQILLGLLREYLNTLEFRNEK